MTSSASSLKNWHNHGVPCLIANCPEMGYSISTEDATLTHIHPDTLYTKFLRVDKTYNRALCLAIWREKFVNSGTCTNDHSKNPKESEPGLVDLYFYKMFQFPEKHLRDQNVNQKIYEGIMPHISKWSKLRTDSACVYCLDAPLQFKISDHFPQGAYYPSSSMSRVQGDHN